MKAVYQRVRHAQVQVDSKTVGAIENGVLLLVGVCPEDTPEQAELLAKRWHSCGSLRTSRGK